MGTNTRVAVIMAGGAGERFWPASRGGRPKQLLRLLGDRTLLEEAIARIAPLIPPERVFLVVGEDIAAAVRTAVAPFGDVQVLVEPARRNTTACLAFAGAAIGARLGSHTMAVLTADHLIRPEERFREQVAFSLEQAESSGDFVLLGKRPDRPETGYGYIELADGAPLAQGSSGTARRVARFHEKPSASVAEEYLRSGRFLWNCGMFFWRSDVFEAGLRQHAPAIGSHLPQLANPEAEQFRPTFLGLPSQPIDIALMEKAPNLRVVEADFDWDDVGTWNALRRLHAADAEGNVRVGEATLAESRDCTVFVEGSDSGSAPKVALYGVENLVVSISGDGILITTREKAPDIKKVVARIPG